jgi:hypothetical protein
VFSTEIINHDGRHSDVMRELAQWRHPKALSEALDVLHQAMCPAWHRRIRMVIEIVADLPAFFVVSISLLATGMVQACVDHFVTSQKRMYDKYDHTKSTTHLTNTITMAVEPPTPAAAWI